MAKTVKVIVLRTAGTNCDQETAFAFRDSGAEVDSVHINQLLDRSKNLDHYHILAIPGGFSYGDDIESGRILANELRFKLGTELARFIAQKKLVIGICNGFQVLAKAGILPGALSEEESLRQDLSPKATLFNNDSGKFEDRWIHLKVNPKSIWTHGLKEILFLPVAHGEGKFMVKDKDVLQKLKQNGQIAFSYVSLHDDKPSYPENPNGSVEDIAGITDTTGHILGLMPHPERHFLSRQHPSWTRQKTKERLGDGAKIFENAVRYAKDYL